jgi:ABC-type nitrate/sulfonate/bicarbonate transport system permease component
MVLLLGYDGRMKMAIVFLGIVWPILLNVTTAVAGLHPLLDEVAASLRMGPWTRTVKIVLPAILPSIMLGVRVALPLAIVIALVIEMLTSVFGLGSLMISAQRDYRAGQVFALLVVVGAIGLLLNLALATLEDRLMRHRQQAADQ